MKFKLVIKLVDCVPSKTVLKIDRDCVEEAKDHADDLYGANAMIESVTVCDLEGTKLYLCDHLDTNE